jgi:uncharacterized membrane protein/predicted DsbA family dithiol-disulfide isomerase
MKVTTSEACESGDRGPVGGRPSRAGLALMGAILVLALAGVATSVELTRIHYLTHTDPSFHSVCAVNETVNCETVAQSPYSVFLGLPISIWGLAAFLAFAVLAGWGLTRRRLHAGWPAGLLFAAAVVAAGVSGLMGWISYVRIDALCLFCVTLYGLSAVLLPVTGSLLRVRRSGPLRALGADLGGLVRRPVLLLALLALAVAALGVPRLLIRPWWHHPGWTDLAELPHGVDEEGRHWIGAPHPLVTVVEFSDYECPYCRQAHRNMRALAAKFPDEVRLVHRHAPLDRACNEDVKRAFHERACEFARAAECAAEQGLFWKMNDALFSVQETVRARDVDIGLLAVQVGIDRSRFDLCLGSDAPRRRLRADLEASRKAGVRGTPTFLIGRQQYPGGFTEEILVRHLERKRGKQAGPP